MRESLFNYLEKISIGLIFLFIFSLFINSDRDAGKDLSNLHKLLTTEAVAQTESSKTTYPPGRQPVAIKNGKYPDSYFPNTELLGPDEMRITRMDLRPSLFDDFFGIAFDAMFCTRCPLPGVFRLFSFVDSV